MTLLATPVDQSPSNATDDRNTSFLLTDSPTRLQQRMFPEHRTLSNKEILLMKTAASQVLHDRGLLPP
jgi:hypothetical protein